MFVNPLVPLEIHFVDVADCLVQFSIRRLFR